MVSMKKFQVLLRCFHIIICKTLLINLCALRGKFSKRDEEGLMGANQFQPHGIGSSPVPLLVGEDHKELLLGLLHPLVLQRQRFLLLLHLQFSKNNDDLLLAQQPLLLHQLLFLLPIPEALFVTSAKVEDMLLLNVLVEGP